MYPAVLILAFLQSTIGSAGDGYLIQTAIANGGIGVVLFVIWFLTFKHALKQFEFALKQNQEQFDKALLQIERQHNANIAEQRMVIDRQFLLMQRDTEYKEILTGVLTEIKEQLKRGR